MQSLILYPLQKHAYSNILKILPPKHENSQIKTSDIFHISAQNIDCGYLLEPPRRGGSNEYPQSMFLSRNKKNNVYPCKPQFYCIKVWFKGVKNIGMFSWCIVALQIRTATYANSDDPDETARNEPCHCLHCLSYCCWFWNRNPFLQQWTWPNSRMVESTSKMQE